MMLAAPRPIRLGFLGIDAATPNLVRAAIESRRFDLAAVCEFASDAPAHAELTALAGQLRPIAGWEDLLDSEQFDAVVVARHVDQDRRAEQLRKFIQVGIPVLAAHPVVDSMLIYYELDMIRRETRSVVVPHLSQRRHPAIEALAAMVRTGPDSPLGKVEHLSFERALAAPERAQVEQRFARDVDVVRAVAGEMTRLGAMGGAAGAGAYASLGVQMSGPGGIAARWSVAPGAAADRAHLVVAGARGRAVLELRADGAPWTLDVDAPGSARREQFPPWDAAAASLAALAGAIDGRPTPPDWVDACRSVELAETIERSLQKSRTVELYYEDYTEEGTFKGTMTSLGCGLLLLAMFALAAVGVAEQVHIPYVRFWPYVLVALCGVFLVVQLVMLTKGKDRDASPPPDAD